MTEATVASSPRSVALPGLPGEPPAGSSPDETQAVQAWHGTVFTALRGHRQGEAETLLHALLQCAAFAVAYKHVGEREVAVEREGDSGFTRGLAIGSRPQQALQPRVWKERDISHAAA